MNAGKRADLSDIHKVFEATDGASGAVSRFTALSGVSLSFYPGEIHVILGENGAGKSTLAHILSGLYRPSLGAIRLGGETLQFDSASDALDNGIAMVHQRPLLADDASVLENVLLGAPGFFLRRARALTRFAKLSASWNISLDPHERARRLSPADRFRVALLGALWRDPDYLILDEPSGVLSPPERDSLFASLGRARDAGLGVIIITHRLEEATTKADRVSVLRRGRLVWSECVRKAEGGKTVTNDFLAHLLDPAGESSTETALRIQKDQPSKKDATPALSIKEISISSKNRPHLDRISIDVMPGTIRAIAGYPGSGLEVLEDVLSGILRPDAGSIAICGETIPVARLSPATLRKRGVAIVPSDRAFRGSNPDITITEMLTAYRRTGLLMRDADDELFVRGILSAEGLEATPSRRVRTLSGGQLQRLILARELSASPRVVILASPEWGLDIRNAALLSRKLSEIAENGAAVLVLSEETGSLGLRAPDYVLKDGQLE